MDYFSLGRSSDWFVVRCYVVLWNLGVLVCYFMVSRFKPLILLVTSHIGTISNSAFTIYGPRGLPLLTQLRVGLSNLHLHKFRHNFKDLISSMCPVNDGPEDTEHYLLLC